MGQNPWKWKVVGLYGAWMCIALQIRTSDKCFPVYMNDLFQLESFIFLTSCGDSVRSIRLNDTLENQL